MSDGHQLADADLAVVQHLVVQCRAVLLLQQALRRAESAGGGPASACAPHSLPTRATPYPHLELRCAEAVHPEISHGHVGRHLAR